MRRNLAKLAALPPAQDRGHRQRSYALDALRAIAILLVIGRHLVPHLPSNLAENDATQFLFVWYDVGWLGVDLFFVLSGYLISGLLFNEMGATGRLRIGRFLVRRGLKIYPAYYVFLAYGTARAAVAALLSPDTNEFGPFLKELWPCLILIQNYFDGAPWGHTWSLAVEEHFYILLPVVFATLACCRQLHWIAPLGIFSILSVTVARTLLISPDADPGWIYSATHLRFDSLLMGVLLRYATLRRHAGGRAMTSIFWLLAGCAPFLLPTFLPWDHPFILGPGLTLISLGSAALIWGAVQIEPYALRLFPRALAAAAFIGRSSYATYLWHVTVIGWSVQLCRVAADYANWSDETLASASILLATLAAIGIGMLMTRLVELPTLRFRDRFFPAKSETALGRED